MKKEMHEQIRTRSSSFGEPTEMCPTVALILVATATAAPMAAKPNIVFFMADDLGWNNVQWHNPTQMKTPHAAAERTFFLTVSRRMPTADAEGSAAVLGLLQGTRCHPRIRRTPSACSFKKNRARALVKSGIELDRHYAFLYCSPSRSSLMTGRLPALYNYDVYGYALCRAVR